MTVVCRFAIVVAVAAGLSAVRAHAQSPRPLQPFIHVGNTYRATVDVTYLKAGNVESRLDVYQNRAATLPSPTLVWIHGGNWVGGSKGASLLSVLPFFELGWNVVNVDYRLVNVAPAPAAVEDCRCALRWVVAHAKDYNIDPGRIVVGGNSAGGQLSLMVALAPRSAGFDTRCGSPADELKIAAVINWYGFPDLAAVLTGPNANAAVNTWIGSGAGRDQLAKSLSPVTYVRPGATPVLTIHGDADPTSPYRYAVQFHEALTRAGVVNQLLTVPGGKHGGFTDAETDTVYAAITSFLGRTVPAPTR